MINRAVVVALLAVLSTGAKGQDETCAAFEGDCYESGLDCCDIVHDCDEGFCNIRTFHPHHGQICGEDCGNTGCALTREDCIDGLCAPAEGNECSELEYECSNFIPCCDTSHDCIVPTELDTSENYIRSGFCRVAESNTGGPCVSEDNCRFEFDLCVDSICIVNPSAQEDASEKTTVTVTTNAYDTRDVGENGCNTTGTGCMAELTRDGDSEDAESRWSCSEKLGEGDCYLEYTFDTPQDVISMNIAFHKGDERTRNVEVLGDGASLGTFTSSGTSLDFENWTLNAGGVTTITLVASGLGYNDWLSITEVQLLDLKYANSC